MYAVRVLLKVTFFQMCSECWGRGRGKNLQNSCIVQSRDKNNLMMLPGEALTYVSVKSKLQHAPPRAYPGHLTPLPSRGGGNLIIKVFPGVGNLIPML